MRTAVDGAALLKRLPVSRGRLEADAPLAELTWFRAGGAAEALFTPADESDLAAFLKATPHLLCRFQTLEHGHASCLCGLIFLDHTRPCGTSDMQVCVVHGPLWKGYG